MGSSGTRQLLEGATSGFRERIDGRVYIETQAHGSVGQITMDLTGTSNLGRGGFGKRAKGRAAVGHTRARAKVVANCAN